MGDMVAGAGRRVYAPNRNAGVGQGANRRLNHGNKKNTDREAKSCPGDVSLLYLSLICRAFIFVREDERGMKMTTKQITRAALVAGLYAVLTIVLAPISYGAVQVRVADALVVLPYIFPETAVGLFVGCIIANTIGGNGVLDIFFGSLSTLVAGVLTAFMPNKWLAPLPPVIIVALIVGWYLSILLNVPMLACMAYIAIGELIACYGLGMIILIVFERKGVARLWK